MTTALEALGRRREKLLGELVDVETQLRVAIVDALRAGERPTAVARQSTYSAAQIRVIARTAGLAPAQQGSRRVA